MFVQRGFSTNTVVFNLIIINVLVYLLMVVSGYNFFPYLALYPPTSEHFLPWQLLSHFFLHISFGHLFFNMIGIAVFGSTLERFWGAKRFLYYYMGCGLGAAICYIIAKYLQVNSAESLEILNNSPALGASGALFGLILAFGMLFPNTELILFPIPIPVKAKYLVIGYGLIELSMVLKQNPGDNVGHLAHLGGMLVGFILIILWKKDRNNFY